MDVFVWTKMGVESGEGLEQIVRRKEAERIGGNGQFWWGPFARESHKPRPVMLGRPRAADSAPKIVWRIGNSLGSAVRDAARERGGRLPVLFSDGVNSSKFILPARPSGMAVW